MANNELDRRWEDWCRNTLPQPDPDGFVNGGDDYERSRRQNITPYTPSELKARPRFMEPYKPKGVEKNFTCKGILEGRQPAR